MDQKQKQILLILSIILIAGIWLYWNNLYRIKMQAIEKARNSLKAVENEIAAIEGSQVILKKGETENKLLEKQLQKLIEKIPTVKEIPFLLNNYFQIVGKNLNIDYQLFVPKALKSKGKYLELPLSVDFQTDYSNFTAYLKELKMLPSTIRIDKLTIEQTPDREKLKIKMDLTAFVMPDNSKKPLPKIDFGVSLVDPFAPLVSPLTEPPRSSVRKQSRASLRLEGFWRGQTTMVFINGQALKVGDRILGYKLVTIGKNSVRLVKNGRILRLKLEGIHD